MFRISEAVPNFQNGSGKTLTIVLFLIWFSAMRLISFVCVKLPMNTEEKQFINKLPKTME